MRYVAPVAELVSLETVSVILTSGLTPDPEETTTVAAPVVPDCPNELPSYEEE